VMRAWGYWAGKKVVSLQKDANGTDCVQFLPLTDAPAEAPEYNAKDISQTILEDKNVSEMFKMCEHILSKPLSTTDITRIYGFYDYYGLSFDVIAVLLSYCVRVGKKNMRYIEKVALGWAEEGLDTAEKANEHVKKMEQYRSKIYKVQKLIGNTGRKLTETEEKILGGWIEKKISSEVIKLAVDTTAMYTGKLDLKYMDKILTDWHQKGLHTAPQVRRAMEDYKNRQPKTTNIKKADGYNSMKQDDFDYAALERRAVDIK